MNNKDLKQFLETEYSDDWSLLENEHDSIVFTSCGLTDDPDDEVESVFDYENEDDKDADWLLTSKIVGTENIR